MDARRQAETIDEYISMSPENVQKILKRLRQTIRETAPEAQEAISYRIPTFKLNGNLVHFAAFKDHIGFFPTSSGIDAFKKQLSQYKTSTGTVQFPIDKPIPYFLVRKIVKYRVRENLSNGKGGKRKQQRRRQ
ncbi:MAG: iron chaperone [Nitrososphaerales archaeon]